MRFSVLALVAFLNVTFDSRPPRSSILIPTLTAWTPPPCGASYSPVLSAEVVLATYAVTVTYTASWDGPPETGILSENSIPLRYAIVTMGEPVVWVYGRSSVTQKQFGFLSLTREDGTRCEVRFDFDVPQTSRRPR